MLDTTRREFIALVGGGGLLLAAKVKRARGQQPAMQVIGFLSTRSPDESAHLVAAFRRGLGAKAASSKAKTSRSNIAGHLTRSVSPS
jgi:hypothetical protein